MAVTPSGSELAQLGNRILNHGDGRFRLLGVVLLVLLIVFPERISDLFNSEAMNDAVKAILAAAAALGVTGDSVKKETA